MPEVKIQDANLTETTIIGSTIGPDQTIISTQVTQQEWDRPYTGYGAQSLELELFRDPEAGIEVKSEDSVSVSSVASEKVAFAGGVAPSPEWEQPDEQVRQEQMPPDDPEAVEALAALEDDLEEGTGAVGSESSHAGAVVSEASLADPEEVAVQEALLAEAAA